MSKPPPRTWTELNLYAAVGARHSSVSIVIEECIPECQSLEEAQSVYRREARELFLALSESLPGGTLDQLGGLLWAHKASLFRGTAIESSQGLTGEQETR